MIKLVGENVIVYSTDRRTLTNSFAGYNCGDSRGCSWLDHAFEKFGTYGLIESEDEKSWVWGASFILVDESEADYRSAPVFPIEYDPTNWLLYTFAEYGNHLGKYFNAIVRPTLSKS